MSRLSDKMYELLALPEGWDTYGAARISPFATLGATKFLETCTQEVVDNALIFPTPRGGVQIEFRDSETEIEFDTVGKVCGV